MNIIKCFLAFAALVHNISPTTSYKRNRVSLEAQKVASIILDNDTDLLNNINTLNYDLTERSLHGENKTVHNFCLPWNSCIGRCGEVHEFPPFTCSCDSDCTLYSDCCVDYKYHCQKISNVTTDLLWAETVPPVCIQSDRFKSPSLMIQDCPSSWSKTKIFDGYQDTANCIDIILKYCRTGYTGMNFSQLVSCIKNSGALDCTNGTYDDICKTTSTGVAVEDTSGLLYHNLGCVACNAKINQTKKYVLGDHHSYIMLNNWQRARKCIPAISTCPRVSNNIKFESLNKLCNMYSGHVLGRNDKLYKNIYCALCNNENIDSLSCPPRDHETFRVYTCANVKRPNIMNVIFNNVVIPQTVGFEDLPATLSILLNFGADGRKQMKFLSNGANEMQTCNKGNIWDPFSKICRKLYCSTEYVLVDYKCVKKDENDDQDKRKEESFGLSSVHLTLTVQAQYIDLLKFYGQANNFTKIVSKSLASAFNISIARIKNLDINISFDNFSSPDAVLQSIDYVDPFHPIVFTIDFDLYELPEDVRRTEPTSNNIVSMLASSMSENGFDLDIENITGKILQLYETSDITLNTWCDPADGNIQREYWNSDFTILLNRSTTALDEDSITGVYINATDKFYERGQFIANILFQGQQTCRKLLNVSGLVIVCDMPKLNSSCIRVMLEEHEYNISDDGELEVPKYDKSTDAVDLNHYEIIENNSVLVCLKKTVSNIKSSYEFDLIEVYVNFILLYISVFALILVLVTYILFPILRNLPGCSTMNLTFSLLAMQVTFLRGQRSNISAFWCATVAKLLHYEILCSFMWMNIMAYDLYKTFGQKSKLVHVRSKTKCLILYMTYAYGCPVIILGTCLLLEEYDYNHGLAPKYGQGDACWIASKPAAYIFFAVPLGFIMATNIIFYVKTIITIKSIKHTAILGTNVHQRGWKDVALYAKMAFVTGLTWTLMFIAAYIRCERLLGRILTYLFIVFNALQGLFIFVVFVCNRRVGHLYTKLMGNMWARIFSGVPVNTINTSRQIFRTISSSTVISTITSSSVKSNRNSLIPSDEANVQLKDVKCLKLEVN